jgi:hypothetical protein
MDPALAGASARASTPLTGETSEASLVASVALSASGAWSRSGIIDVEGARRIVLLVSYLGGAIGGYPRLLPLCSAKVDSAVDADDWYAPGVWDGSVVAGTLGGTLPSGADYTGAPDFARMLCRAGVIELEPVDATTDRIRVAISIDVSWAKRFQLAYAEAGVTATPGTLAVEYALVA